MSLTTYKDCLKKFTVQKIRFQRFQKLNLFLSFIFMVFFVPVSVKMLTGKDISLNSSLWFIIIPVSVMIFVFFSKWVLKHYNHTLKKAEELLSDIECR